MKRTTLDFTIDLLAFIDLICLTTTGLIMKYVLPPGSGGRGRALREGHGSEHIQSLFSLGRHDWGDIHFYLAVGFVVLMIIHLILHFNWIKNYCKSLFRPSKGSLQ